jgi:SAM-dependent methyltransferase
MQDYTSPLNVHYRTRYDDLPRKDLVELITEPPGSVLELGCGAGATGALVKQRFGDVRYVGIELDHGAAAIARRRLDEVIVANIEQVDLKEHGLAKESFDLIICGDVLEHLYDPWKALYLLRDYLKPQGKLLASIPNTQNIGVILHLLNGNWTYMEHGLLDATHIRFFTLREIDKLFSGTGYEIVSYNCILQRQVESDGWPRDLEFGRLVIKNVSMEEAKLFYTFQYLVTARRKIL